MTITYAKFNFNVTGAKRKELVSLISRFTGCEAKYKGAPSFAYEIDYFTVTKDGTLIFDDRADSEEIEQLFEALAAAGFQCERAGETEENARQGEDMGDPRQADRLVGERTSSGMNELSSLRGSEGYGACEDALTVEIPLDKVSVDNLTNLLDSKETLIKKALGIEDIRIEVKEDRVSFPWFDELPDADEVKAYTHFIAALCKLSKEQSRVNAAEKEVANEKYAFRCFLLRLGFIGKEYKEERKILLKNLTGSTAFKNGGAEHEISE